MSRKIYWFALSAMLLALSFQVEAQQAGKVPRIGYVSLNASTGERDEAFKLGLRDLGYIEGQNISIEYRYAAAKADRLPGLTSDLVRLKVDVITTVGTQAARAAQQATKTIPIVIVSAGDPVATGLVASLARPGGNITGLSSLTPELSGKRLELLREAVVDVSRVAVLVNPDNPTSRFDLREMEVAAQALKLQLQTLEVRGPDDFDSAFRAAATGRAGALILSPAPLTSLHGARIAALALKSRLPAISPYDTFAAAGGLMAYGPSLTDQFRRAAIYVDRILKGTKPADLPVERPMKFELVINLKTAKALGLTIPQSVLYRADKVIK